MTNNKLTDEQIMAWVNDANSILNDGSSTLEEMSAASTILALCEELQEYRKAAQPLTDPERLELIKLRQENVIRRAQWAQSMQHDPTFGGILPKL